MPTPESSSQSCMVGVLWFAGMLMSGLSLLCMVLFFNIFFGSYMAMQVCVRACCACMAKWDCGDVFQGPKCSLPHCVSNRGRDGWPLVSVILRFQSCWSFYKNTTILCVMTMLTPEILNYVQREPYQFILGVYPCVCMCVQWSLT